jgi:hypothetical protein
MRLVKLAAYSLLGFVIYEFIVGMQEAGTGRQHRGQSHQPQRGGRRRAGNAEGAKAMTGKGQGKRVEVTGAGGTVEHERVGRGVIH